MRCAYPILFCAPGMIGNFCRRFQVLHTKSNLIKKNNINKIAWQLMRWWGKLPYTFTYIIFLNCILAYSSLFQFHCTMPSNYYWINYSFTTIFYLKTIQRLCARILLANMCNMLFSIGSWMNSSKCPSYPSYYVSLFYRPLAYSHIFPIPTFSRNISRVLPLKMVQFHRKICPMIPQKLHVTQTNWKRRRRQRRPIYLLARVFLNSILMKNI